MAGVDWHIAWTDACETGYGVTDGRHESLACLFNDHVRYLKRGVSPIALRGSFDILMAELRLHFAEDCAFVTGVKFSREKPFMVEHMERIGVIDRIYHHTVDDHLIRAVTPTLHDWVRAHIDWGYLLTSEFDPVNLTTHVPPYPTTPGDRRIDGAARRLLTLKRRRPEDDTTLLVPVG